MNNRSQMMGKMALSALVTVLLAGLGIVQVASAQVTTNESIWDAWTTESYTMAPRESFQLTMDYKDIISRRWLLVVDGGDANCDLSVLRVNGEELLYYKNDERHHEVSIPWGLGEKIILVLTNRDYKGAFTVSVLGPPKGQNHASYTYSVNRALEAYASGQRLEALNLCRRALREDPDDGVAKVLLAGFYLEGNDFAEAEVMIDEALDSDLPPDMQTLAETLATELKARQAPLPRSVRKGLTQAEEDLGKNHPEDALEVCDRVLATEKKLSASSRAQFHVLRGRALEALGRNFEAVDAFTQALNNDRSKAAQAMSYYYMGALFLKMDNLNQAEGAYTIALDYGLPTGLELQAREDLKMISDRLNDDRGIK